MGNHGIQPNPNRQLLAARHGYAFYTDNAFAVRDAARPGEEGGPFATPAGRFLAGAATKVLP